MTYEEMQAKQLRLSIVLAALFLVTMFMVPFMNHFYGDAMLAPILGIPFVWFFVGIVFHIEFWIIAFVYTYYSNKWEAETVDG